MRRREDRDPQRGEGSQAIDIPKVDPSTDLFLSLLLKTDSKGLRQKECSDPSSRMHLIKRLVDGDFPKHFSCMLCKKEFPEFKTLCRHYRNLTSCVKNTGNTFD